MRELKMLLKNSLIIILCSRMVLNHFMARCGVYIPRFNTQLSFALPDICSVYSAESFAVIKALNWALEHNCYKIIIATDSLSLVHSLMSNCVGKFKCPLIRFIYTMVYQITSFSGSCVFLWCKGHAGIHGNEEADRLAKAGAYSDDLITSIPSKDWFTHKKRQVFLQWKEDWDDWASSSLSQYANIHQFLPNINLLDNKNKQSIMIRMKTAHGRYPAHLHKIKILNSPNCSCGTHGDLDHY